MFWNVDKPAFLRLNSWWILILLDPLSGNLQDERLMKLDASSRSLVSASISAVSRIGCSHVLRTLWSYTFAVSYVSVYANDDLSRSESHKKIRLILSSFQSDSKQGNLAAYGWDLIRSRLSCTFMSLYTTCLLTSESQLCNSAVDIACAQ